MCSSGVVKQNKLYFTVLFSDESRFHLGHADGWLRVWRRRGEQYHDEGRKEMLYLTTHSTHFILRLYGVRHMVKVHSDSERGNLLPPRGLFCFPINSKGSFYMHHPTDMLAHTTVFVTPVVEHWLKQKNSSICPPMMDRSDDPSHHERTFLPQSYVFRWVHCPN